MRKSPYWPNKKIRLANKSQPYFYHSKQVHPVMQTESRYTQWKIIAGYLLVILLGVVSGSLIYKQVTRFIVNEETMDSTNRKLFIIGNTMTGLYEAEALSSAFAQTGSHSYFRKFTSIIRETRENIDTLRTLSQQLDQQIRIDSIHTLLEAKIKNLQELVWVKQSFSPEEFYSKAIANIVEKDSSDQQPNVRQRMVTRVDTTYVQTQKVVKRWIFSKTILDTVPEISLTQQIVSDTLNDENFTQNTDSVVNILRNTWEDVQKQQQNLNRKINQKEYTLIRQSTDITNQLKRILREYEKEEIYYSLHKQENREKTIATTIRIFSWITVIALLSVIFFTFFILRDLSRSQRYRRELENANRYAAQLLKSREKMIQNVTHDIKSPLSSVLGYIELLNNTPVNDRQRYFLKNMQGSSEHILKLIGNLLDLSKLENHKMPVEEVVFNPASLFREIIDNFLPLAQNKHLQLTGNFSEELNQDCRGDALRIRQIITNILSNAVKYTELGRVDFTATTSADGTQIILAIQDTGPGMSADEQKLVFEEFTRLKSHNGIEGTGLGLTITLKLIHLLGGELTLQSEIGKGSCFTLYLPRQEASLASEAETTPRLPEAPRKPEPDLRILLVDDDTLQLQMTQGLLEARGIHPDITTHPLEVVRLLQEKTYDLVFSDIQMPEMTGFELVKQIRQLDLPFAQSIPVIALSADATQSEADYIAEGFTAYLGKPFTSAALFHLIDRLTGKQHATASLQAASPVTEPAENAGYTLKNIRIFADNDPEALKKIIQSFVTSTEQHLGLLRQYLQDKHYENISQLAHKMLPMFRHLEASLIVEALEKLEHPDKADLTPETINTLVTEVIEEVERLLKLIQ